MPKISIPNNNFELNLIKKITVILSKVNEDSVVYEEDSGAEVTVPIDPEALSHLELKVGSKVSIEPIYNGFLLSTVDPYESNEEETDSSKKPRSSPAFGKLLSNNLP